MLGYYLGLNDRDLLYIPRNLIVFSDSENYDVRTSPDEIKIFDDYWAKDGLCLFEEGVHNSRESIGLFASLNIPDYAVMSHRDNCFFEGNGRRWNGGIGLADIEAISMFEDAKEAVLGF